MSTFDHRHGTCEWANMWDDDLPACDNPATHDFPFWGSTCADHAPLARTADEIYAL